MSKIESSAGKALYEQQETKLSQQSAAFIELLTKRGILGDSSNIIYLIDSEGYVASELPSGYVEIGKIEGNASADKAQNWYSQGCKVGESIYQSPDRSDEILVYTTLFSGNGEYRYIRFVQFDK